MMKTIYLAVIVAALLVVGLPSEVSAYGAAHVGYTHVGPNGVYHTGATTAGGYGGAYGGVHTTTAAYGGAAGGAYHTSATYGGAAGGAYHTSAGYSYAPSYTGAAYGRTSYSYGYVR